MQKGVFGMTMAMLVTVGAISEPRRGYALSPGSALATSRAYLANNSVTS